MVLRGNEWLGQTSYHQRRACRSEEGPRQPGWEGVGATWQGDTCHSVGISSVSWGVMEVWVRDKGEEVEGENALNKQDPRKEVMEVKGLCRFTKSQLSQVKIF